MMKLVYYEFFKRLNSAPKFRRRLKIFAAISLVGVVLSGALAIWVGIAAFDYVARTASSITTPQKVADVAHTFASGKPLLQPGCLDKTKTMFNLAQWLERPLRQSFREIRDACVKGKQDQPSTKASSKSNAAYLFISKN